MVSKGRKTGNARTLLEARITCVRSHNSSGCGKREAHINWSMVIPEKAAPVTRTTLRTAGPVPVDFRQ